MERLLSFESWSNRNTYESDPDFWDLVGLPGLR